jgi:hypothetical protein
MGSMPFRKKAWERHPAILSAKTSSIDQLEANEEVRRGQHAGKSPYAGEKPQVRAGHAKSETIHG